MITKENLFLKWFPFFRFLTSLNFARYKADYVKLYVDTIMPIVKKEDPCRPYVTSSPSNGIQTKKEDWVALNPGDLRFGDSNHFFISYIFLQV